MPKRWKTLGFGLAAMVAMSGCGQAGRTPTAVAAANAGFESAGLTSKLASLVAATDKQGFESADANHDGGVTPQEAPFLTAETFQSRDRDHDGRLSYEETRIGKAVVAGQVKLVAKALAGFYTQLDTNGDQTLDAQELAAADLAPVSRGPVTAESFLDALEAADAQPVARGKSAKPPVHMIPGFVMPPFTFFPMRNALRKAGYTDFTVLNQWPWFGRIEEYAALSRMHIDGLKKRSGHPKVEVLGHSMGGLTARALVKYQGGDKDVAHVVQFGTPNHGTVLGSLAGWMLPSCKQMSLGSDFLAALNDGDPTPGAIKWTSVHANWDEIVVPAKSVDLEGAENPLVKRTFHIHMMFHPETHRLAIEALSK